MNVCKFLFPVFHLVIFKIEDRFLERIWMPCEQYYIRQFWVHVHSVEPCKLSFFLQMIMKTIWCYPAYELKIKMYHLSCSIHWIIKTLVQISPPNWYTQTIPDIGFWKGGLQMVGSRELTEPPLHQRAVTFYKWWAAGPCCWHGHPCSTKRLLSCPPVVALSTIWHWKTWQATVWSSDFSGDSNQRFQCRGGGGEQLST